jgi:acyl-coenzyme A synthetase/AMP-(fatty) acid ligase
VSFIPLSALLATGRAPDHPVALSGSTAIGFAEFAAAVAGVAGHLRKTGCRRAALQCQDSYRFAVGLFGLFHAGIAAILLPNGQDGTRAALGEAFDLLIDDAYLAGIPAEAATLVPLDPTGTILEFFTSGSTGEAKRIVKSLAQLEPELAVLEQLWGRELGPGPTLATVSHQHIYGMTFKLLWPLSAGRPFAADRHEVWETLLDRLPPDAIIVASPAHLGRLGGVVPLPARHRLRGIFSAGSPLSLAAAQDTLAILGVLPTEIFGSTETGAIATRRQAGVDTAWHALPGLTVAADGAGVLRLRSPFLATTDWVETGDVIAPAADGFHLRGRADRIVKIEAKRISLAGVEAALRSLPWIDAAAALALPGEPARLAAAVVPSATGQAKLAELGSFRFSRLLRRELQATQESAGLPRQWRFCERLPSDTLGKRRDGDLLALFRVGGS